MPRLVGDWINEYVRYITETSESSEHYHFWSAATVLGGALKRHVWLGRGDYKLFPNLFTVLVGHPGIGKGRAINPAVSLLREAGSANIMSDKLTIQYILETLSKGFGVMTHSGVAAAAANAVGAAAGGFTFGTDTSCFISAPELQVFLATSDALPSLSELWEGKDGPSDYGTRGKGLVRVSKPCPSLLGGCTPRQIVSSIPNEAIMSGFTRRVNFVYEGDNSKRIPWPAPRNGTDPVRDRLVNDMRHISQLSGEYRFSADAAPVFEAYYRNRVVDEFLDEATSTYEVTKWAHASKLAMVLSAARSDDMIISKADFIAAKAAVEQCSEDLKKVFRAVGDSELTVATEKVLRFIEMKGFTSRQEILGALWRDIGSTTVLDMILATLEQGHLVLVEDKGGKTMFRCHPKKGKP